MCNGSSGPAIGNGTGSRRRESTVETRTKNINKTYTVYADTIRSTVVSIYSFAAFGQLTPPMLGTCGVILLRLGFLCLMSADAGEAWFRFGAITWLDGFFGGIPTRLRMEFIPDSVCIMYGR